MITWLGRPAGGRDLPKDLLTVLVFAGCIPTRACPCLIRFFLTRNVSTIGSGLPPPRRDWQQTTIIESHQANTSGLGALRRCASAAYPQDKSNGRLALWASLAPLARFWQVSSQAKVKAPWSSWSLHTQRLGGRGVGPREGYLGDDERLLSVGRSTRVWPHRRP